MYHFARCQPRANCPDLQGWYLILKPGDVETLERLHRGVAHLYYAKFSKDSHADPGGVQNPIRLGALWLVTVERFLARHVTLAINSSGGMSPLDDLKVLATAESTVMVWPNHHEGEVITISRWKDSKHFYLSSNRDRVFVPPKYVRYEDALHMAQIYTENIETGDAL